MVFHSVTVLKCYSVTYLILNTFSFILKVFILHLTKLESWQLFHHIIILVPIGQEDAMAPYPASDWSMDST